MLDESRCPDLETLAAYTDGRLDTMRRENVTNHLAGCDDCLMAVGFAHEVRNEEASAVMPARRRVATWLAAAATLIVIAGIAAIALRLRPSPNGVAALIAAAPHARYRIVEPRLAGFAWTELKR